MSAFSQQRLLDEPDGTQCHIATSGRTIRPFLRPIDALVGECKLHASADGLEVTSVDPANVAMVHIEAPAEAFDSYLMDGDAEEMLFESIEDQDLAEGADVRPLAERLTTRVLVEFDGYAEADEVRDYLWSRLREERDRENGGDA